ncbi:MAG: ATP-binding protein [Pseudomonadota bacterium]
MSEEKVRLRERIIALERQSANDLTALSSLLAAERATLRAVIENAPEAIVVTDLRGAIILTNSAARKLYPGSGPFEKQDLNLSHLGLCHPDGTPIEPDDLPMNATAVDGEPVLKREMAIALPGGALCHILVNTAPIMSASRSVAGVVTIFQDISARRNAQIDLEMRRTALEAQVESRNDALSATISALRMEIQERERIEEQLRQSEAELRRITQRTMEALEADRQVIAKELHDSIGASLAAIKFSLEERIARGRNGRNDLEPVVRYLIDAIKETKRISANLRPAILDDLGLLSTMKWYFREFETLYRQISVRQEVLLDEDDIPETLKIVIYRILQEAMSNAAKHGTPDVIGVRLAKGEDNIILDVEDDGHGFDTADARIIEDPMRGHGLRGMRERAEICGGTFDLAAIPGVGTRIHVTLPRRKFIVDHS